MLKHRKNNTLLPFLAVASLVATLSLDAAANDVGRIAVIGATGFIGRHPVESLVNDGREVVAAGRSPAKLAKLSAQARHQQVDLDSAQGVARALRGAKVAYYLVHSMEGSTSAGFAAREARCAKTFARMAKAAGVERVIYVGGIQPADAGQASEHLRSRDHVSKILARYGPPTTTLQTSLVLGKGTHALKMLENIFGRTPVIGLPIRVTRARSQRSAGATTSAGRTSSPTRS